MCIGAVFTWPGGGGGGVPTLGAPAWRADDGGGGGAVRVACDVAGAVRSFPPEGGLEPEPAGF